MSRWRWAAARLADLSLLAVLVLVVIWAWPAPFGGSTSYVVVSGDSMQPTYETGDIVIARPGSHDIGDVVVYTVPEGQPGAGASVVHRITGGDAESGWELTGDNNAGPDQWRPTDSDIVGTVRWHLPGAGRAMLGLANPFLFSTLIVVGALLLLLPQKNREDSGEGGEDPSGALTEADSG